MTKVIHNITLDEFKTALSNLSKDSMIILRFTAEWCSPCQKINEDCNNFFSTCDEKITPYVIDISESLDLYATLKKYKMIKPRKIYDIIFLNNKIRGKIEFKNKV